MPFANVPTGHVVAVYAQDGAPPGLYAPAGQGEQKVPPEEEKVPAGQVRHVEADVAPSVALYDPAAQRAHVELEEAPTAAEYVPATQLVHDAVLPVETLDP